MSLTDLTIDGQTDAYKSYASLDEANRRLAVDPVRRTAWECLSDNDKKVHLVAGTYRLDLMPWQGEKAGGADQENAWPRSGLSYPDGSDIADDEVPLGIEEATILLAATIASTPKASGAGSTSSPIRRVQAGSAQVEFFYQNDRIDGKPLQDETAFELILPFLESRADISTPAVSGTCGKSTFEDDDYGMTQGMA